MPFTQIEADDPYVQPAKEEKVYNKFWMESFRVVAKTPNDKATAIAHVAYYDGAGNVCPDNVKKIVTIEDLFGKAPKRPDIAIAMNATFDAINNWIKDKKWFDTTVQPLITKQNRGEELTQEELDLIQQAEDKALI